MLKFGVAWDQSPVRNAQERTVLLPDENRAWLSAGVKYQMSKADAFDFAYTFVKVKNASINNDQSAAPARAGIVTGSYEGKVHVFGVQYQHTF